MPHLKLNLSDKFFVLAQAMILGEKKMIDSDLRDDFSKTGLSHILAISGLYVMILSLISSYFLIFIGFNRRNSFYILLFFWIFYLFFNCLSSISNASCFYNIKRVYCLLFWSFK